MFSFGMIQIQQRKNVGFILVSTKRVCINCFSKYIIGNFVCCCEGLPQTPIEKDLAVSLLCSREMYNFVYLYIFLLSIGQLVFTWCSLCWSCKQFNVTTSQYICSFHIIILFLSSYHWNTFFFVCVFRIVVHSCTTFIRSLFHSFLVCRRETNETNVESR